MYHDEGMVMFVIRWTADFISSSRSFDSKGRAESGMA
jgi:hypothetical protein